MARNERQPPRNRDQEQVPPRKGETIEPTVTPGRGQGERDRNAPLPEEETYEREPRDQRPRRY